MSMFHNWGDDDEWSPTRLEEGDICARILLEKKKYKQEFIKYLEHTYLANPSEIFMEKIIEGARLL